MKLPRVSLYHQRDISKLKANERLRFNYTNNNNTYKVDWMRLSINLYAPLIHLCINHKIDRRRRHRFVLM